MRAKTTGGRGSPLGPDRFGDGPLGEHRRKLCAEVEAVARGPREFAQSAFMLPDGIAADALAANRVVSTARTRPALDRYAGVVYDALGAASLTSAERAVAVRSVLVFSGLFGVVGAGERVPDYRVPAAAVLPGTGSVGASWRPILREVLPTRLGRSGLVIDLRSTDYAAMWRPAGDLLARVVAVRVLSPRPSGTPAVVSYFSKYGKGRLARALIVRAAAGGEIASADDVAQLWTATEGGDAHVTVRGGRIALDLVTAS